MRKVHTFCGVCEPHCALVAEVGATVEGGIRLRPDAEHPVHKGFACHKGLGFTEIHNDPDRLNHPRRRTTPKQAAAAFANIGWGEAFDEIASRLSDLCAVYGPEAVGVYTAKAVRATTMPLAKKLLITVFKASIFHIRGGR